MHPILIVETPSLLIIEETHAVGPINSLWFFLCNGTKEAIIHYDEKSPLNPLIYKNGLQAKKFHRLKEMFECLNVCLNIIVVIFIEYYNTQF